MQRLALALILALVVAGPPVALAMGAGRPDREGPVLIVYPPWASPERIAARAGGRVIGLSAAPLGALVAAPPGAEELVPRLREAGAWAVLDGSRLAELCGVDA